MKFFEFKDFFLFDVENVFKLIEKVDYNQIIIHDDHNNCVSLFYLWVRAVIDLNHKFRSIRLKVQLGEEKLLKNIIGEKRKLGTIKEN